MRWRKEDEEERAKKGRREDTDQLRPALEFHKQQFSHTKNP